MLPDTQNQLSLVYPPSQLGIDFSIYKATPIAASTPFTLVLKLRVYPEYSICSNLGSRLDPSNTSKCLLNWLNSSLLISQLFGPESLPSFSSSTCLIFHSFNKYSSCDCIGSDPFLGLGCISVPKTSVDLARLAGRQWIKQVHQ